MFLHIWFKPHTVRPEDSAGGRFQVVELDFPSFEAACDAMNGGELIQGELINSRFTGDGVRTINRREPLAFSGSSVDRIQPSPWAFEEALA